jgi:hypothetical protein
MIVVSPILVGGALNLDVWLNPKSKFKALLTRWKIVMDTGSRRWLHLILKDYQRRPKFILSLRGNSGIGVKRPN